MSDQQSVVPLWVVVIIVALSIALTGGVMAAMVYGGIQIERARNLSERQEELTVEAITMVDSAVVTIRCFAGDCP